MKRYFLIFITLILCLFSSSVFAKEVGKSNGGEVNSVEDLKQILGENISINGNDIKLVNHIKMNGTITINSGNYFINLNGKTLSSNDTVFVVNGGVIKISDSDGFRSGTITIGTTVNNKSMPALILNSGDVTIDGGNIESNDNGIKVNGSKLKINNGSISGISNGIEMVSGECIVNGGMIKGNKNGFIISSDSLVDVSFSSGVFSGDYAVRIDSCDENSKISISGGTFSGERIGLFVDSSIISNVRILGGKYSVKYDGVGAICSTGNLSSMFDKNQVSDSIFSKKNVDDKKYNVTSLNVEVGPVHNITINNSEAGTLSLNSNKAVESQKVNIEYKPKLGYEITGVVVKDSKGNKIDVLYDSFVMPDDDVFIDLSFKKVGYSIDSKIYLGGGLVLAIIIILIVQKKTK